MLSLFYHKVENTYLKLHLMNILQIDHIYIQTKFHLMHLLIEKDIFVNKIKGLLYGYYIGASLSTSVDNVRHIHALLEINDIVFENNTVNIDFSNQFVEKSTDDKQRYNSIYAIVKSLTELTEVNEIKIMIDGNEIDGFIEIGLDFKKKFNIKMFEQ